MRLTYTAEEEAFRQEVRDFVRDKLPAGLKYKVQAGLRLDRADYVVWYKLLHAKGWITPGWAKEHGGTGWTQIQKLIFDEETLLGGAPRVVGSGINMLGPVLIAFGTDEQKARYLPPIRSGDMFWGQGFSEPNAGSDLASLRTRAELTGGEFIVTGHKTWTSYAHECEMMFALVRTDPAAKPQQGISFLLIDLKAPGVTVRPIRMIEGGRDLNEVYLDEVRVPRENLVGELNKGWDYAKYLLGYERTAIAGVGATKQQLHRLKHLAARRTRRGRPLSEDPIVAARIARLEIETLALEFTTLRMLTERPGATPGPEASMLKIRGTELRQAVYELLAELAGPDALPFDEETLSLGDPDRPDGLDFAGALAANYFDSRKISIYGGANEVQRNLVAKTVLGL